MGLKKIVMITYLREKNILLTPLRTLSKPIQGLLKECQFCEFCEGITQVKGQRIKCNYTI